MLKRTLCIIMFMFLGFCLHAQFKFGFDFNFSNNFITNAATKTDQEQNLGLGLGSFISYQNKRIETVLNGSFQYDKLINEQHISYSALYDLDFVLSKYFELYVIAVHEYLNDIFHIDAGPGIKLTYFQRPDQADISISMVPFYTWQGEQDLLNGFVWEDMEHSLRLSFRHRIKLQSKKKGVQFRSVVFYKPNALNWYDFIVSGEHSIAVKINKTLAISIGHNFTYTSLTHKYDDKIKAGILLEIANKKKEEPIKTNEKAPETAPESKKAEDPADNNEAEPEKDAEE